MKFFALVIASLSFIAPAAWADTPTIERPIAVVRALDKVTGRVDEVQIRKELPYKFGSVVITVHSCRVTTPEEAPESAAFLDVYELKTGQDKTPIFSGWMFASSPALSAMEHPVYDLWLIGCKKNPPKSDSKIEKEILFKE